MLYGFLVALYIVICFVLMGLILIQKSKGSLGIGNIGGSMQMLFGGGGGQSFLQKLTWGLGAAFMILSLTLALMRSSRQETSRYLPSRQAPQAQEQPAPVPAKAPVNAEPAEQKAA